MFRIRIFFADPDPGKNLHADPDLGGIRGVKENFFHVSDDSEQHFFKNEIEFMNIFSTRNCLKRIINTKKHMLPSSPDVKMIPAFFL